MKTTLIAAFFTLLFMNWIYLRVLFKVITHKTVKILSLDLTTTALHEHLSFLYFDDKIYPSLEILIPYCRYVKKFRSNIFYIFFAIIFLLSNVKQIN